MMKERASFTHELLEGTYFFSAPETFDETTVKKKWNDASEALMNEWVQELSSFNDFSSENIENAFKAFLEKKQLGMGAVLPLFRLTVTGQGMGPSMFEIAAVLGKDEVLKRIEASVLLVEKLKVKS
jgi:glutamyl-tRNA synthetase